MRVNTIVTLGASAAFGLLSIFLARGWINDAVQSEFSETARAPLPVQSARAPSVATRQVLVADLDFSFGDTLTAQDLRLVDMPEALVPEGSFSDFEHLLGDNTQRTVALSRMTVNEPILDYKISGPGGRGSLSSVISEGMRATSIRVDEVAGVGGFVLPGDYVDVLVTREVGDGGRDSRKYVTDTLIQNLKVLGTDQNANTETSGATVVRTVTLETTPQQAQRLTLGMNVGTLSLTLRRIAAMEIAPIASLSEQALISGRAKPRRTYGTVKTTPKPAAVNPVAQVTIIRPTGRDEVSVRREAAGLPVVDIFGESPALKAAPQTKAAEQTPSDTLAGGQNADSARQAVIAGDR